MLKITVDDGSASCQLTFFSFYASQQKAMAVGTRWRIRGEGRVVLGAANAAPHL